MLVTRLVGQINATHGTDFRVLGKYEGGEFGAFRLVDGHGRRFVLKGRTPTPPAEVAATTAALAAIGYPAPRYVVVGDEYSIQEELPGTPLRTFAPLDRSLVDRLIELNELQAGRAVLEPRDWPRVLVRSVLEGEVAYMVLETLVRHSDDSRRLLERCQDAVRRYGEEATVTADVVHWDFHQGNVLADGGRVTGVVDWDATTSGDRLFDLATLLYYAPAESRVRDYVVSRAGRGVLAAYLAHMCIREADWSLRLYGGETGAGALRYALEVAESFPF